MKKFSARTTNAERAQQMLATLPDLADLGHGEEPPTPSPSGPVRVQVAHASKFPPSTSGVGLYAAVFDQVLARWGHVERYAFPPSPTESQQLRKALREFCCGRFRPMRHDVVQVELSGRALAELYFTLGMLLRRRRSSWIVLTCHDAPAVVGLPMMFTVLDRRGLRRLGAFLSHHLGVRVERFVLRNADTVVALTGAGADALSERFGRPVHRVGHVMSAPGPISKKEHIVFLPGFVADDAPLAEIARVTFAAGRGEAHRWRLVIGLVDAAHVAHELSHLSSEQRSCVTVTGAVDEQALLELFMRSAIVLRVRGREVGGNALAASGPLSWAVAHGCLCVTDDSRSGARELADAGLIRSVSDPVAELAVELAANGPHTLTAEQRERARALFGPAAVHRRLMNAVRADVHAALSGWAS